MKIFLLGARCLEEGANGGTQFSVNYYFFGQMSVLKYYFLANSQLSTDFG